MGQLFLLGTDEPRMFKNFLEIIPDKLAFVYSSQKHMECLRLEQMQFLKYHDLQ